MIKNCLICNKEFKAYLSNVKKGYSKFCSRKCYEVSRRNKPLSEEWKRKIGIGNKGKKRSLEAIEKYRQRMLGTKMSKKTRLKLSIAHKGKPAWNKGIKKWWKSPNDFKKGHVPWNKNTKGIVKAWNKGKKGFFHHSEETKNKIRKKLIGRPSPTKGKHISKEHIEALRKSRLGKPNYKTGGRVKTQFGYILIHKPKHPFCNCRGYVREHRLVIEKHLGRFLKPQEVVHHINEIRDDNRPENLMLFASEKNHRKFHNSYADVIV